MEQRKIQLIAGTTYSVSLPKAWVLKNKLKAKDPVSIHVRDDQSLIIFPQRGANLYERDASFNLNIDDYKRGIGQMLFSLYYIGFEDIIISSSKEMKESTKNGIKKVIRNMSGTEIVYEDRFKIRIKVLLDKSKLDIKQIFYRVALIISSTIDGLKKGSQKEVFQINEDEIDRLYHLLAKILSLSTLNTGVLKSSNVLYSSYIMPYSLVSKKLENVGDTLYHLSKELRKMKKNRIGQDKLFLILEIVEERIRKSITYVVGDHKKIFYRTEKEKREKIKKLIKEISNDTLRIHSLDLMRYLTDIEEEMVNISFYQKLIQKRIL